MRALRGGNTLVESLGISAFRVRSSRSCIAALLAALSGWLYAHHQPLRQPGAVRRRHGHRIPDDGDGRRRRTNPRRASSALRIVTLLKNWLQD